MAKEEGIAQDELDTIPGTGKEGRVTKDDMRSYIENRSAAPTEQPKTVVEAKNPESKKSVPPSKPPVSVSGEDEIIEMTRMGKLIAHHMVESTQTSAHVQSFVECDVTNIWNWRNKVKNEYATHKKPIDYVIMGHWH